MSGRAFCLCLLTFFCAFTVKTVNAQNNKGKVVVLKDDLLSVMQEKRLEYFLYSPQPTQGSSVGEKGTVLGFRVQIYTGTSRSGAYAAQSEFQKLYPHINTYVSYTQPNYRVKVGDFRSRSDAQSMMNALRKRFNVFLFTEEVNVTE